MDPRRVNAILGGEDRSFAAAALRAATAAAEPWYRAAVALRNRSFDSGLRRPVSLGRPTISVGNLTTGGTGKTPMVIEVARRLRAMGGRPAVLLRGYRGGAGESDEGQELRAALGPDVPVEADADRAAAARRALEREPAVTAFVLDDAFQHRQVRRDLDLVLIDATLPWGHDRLLPRGLLREPVTSLRRADAVIVTRADQAAPEALRAVGERVERLTGRPPIAHASQAWEGWRVAAVDTLAESQAPLDALRQAAVTVACAIGNPTAFERQVRGHVGRVDEVHVWADHHAFDPADVEGVLGHSPEGRSGPTCASDALVMTEKDWVKWQPLLAGRTGPAVPLPIYRPILRVRFDPDDAMDALLRGVAGSKGPTP